jgi:hypothetical protein
MPAALATLAGVALLTASRWRASHVVAVVAAVVALPWLGSKYVPVAAALAVLLFVGLLRRGARRPAGAVLAALGLCGAVYLAVHRLVWGGWTEYASGDHFQQTGEFSVVGVDPGYLGRSLRWTGLLVDERYGLVPWQPAWLLLVPAVVALVVRRPSGWGALLLPLAAAWVTAVWVALTMHGFWWPGRQVVVVLPLATVGVLWLVDRVLPRLRVWAAVLGAFGVVSMAVLLVQGRLGPVTWVVHFEEAGAPSYRLLAPLLPDYTGDDFMLPHLVWTALLLATAAATFTVLRRRPALPAAASDRMPDTRVRS